jgi:hypothetical protein
VARRPRWAEYEWQSYEDYLTANANTLDKDPDSFLGDHTVETNLEYGPRGSIVAVTKGDLLCHRNVEVAVEIYAETRKLKRPSRREMRVISVRYNAHIRGRHAILRYDDHGAGNEDWHVHRWDTALQTLVVVPITRADLPTLEELVLEVRNLMAEF